MHPLIPPPGPYYYLHEFCLGVIEGEMSFDFVKKQCLLPTNGYFKVETIEKPVFVEGKLLLPVELFDCTDGLLGQFFPNIFDSTRRYKLAIGDKEIAELKTEYGFRFISEAGKKFTEVEKILRAKKAARDARE